VEPEHIGRDPEVALGPLQRPRDEGDASLLATVGNLEPVAEDDRIVSVGMLTEGWDCNTVTTSSVCGHSCHSYFVSR